MPSVQEAVAYAQSLNRRTRTPIPAGVADSLPPVYIFNVYDQEWPVNMGGLGQFLIPACPEGQPHSRPLVLKGLIPEEYDLADGNGHMGLTWVTGKELAKNIVGIESSRPMLDIYTTNKEWFGVFISENEKPTAKELEHAKKKLDQFMTLLLQHGDKLALQGEKGIVQIGEMHRRACKFKNQKRTWADVPETMVNCPGCGEPIKPGIARCPREMCGAIIDEAKARKLYPHLFQEPKKSA